MKKSELEVIFDNYLNEATTISKENDSEHLLTTTYIELFQNRNILLWLEETVVLEKKEYCNEINRQKILIATGKLFGINDVVFLSGIYGEKKELERTLGSYAELLSTSIGNHNQIVEANDMVILPYHYAIIKLLNYAIINQNNYNDEISRKVKCYQCGEEYQEVFHDESKELIPFIKSKLNSIIIDDPIGDDIGGDTLFIESTKQKSKRFPS